MKLGANEIQEEDHENKSNLAEYSADWDDGKFKSPKRNFKHAKRKGVQEKQAGNVVKWSGRNAQNDKR